MTDGMIIPLFPLRTVLFPDGPLPLRIFETRYIDMVRRCMRSQGVFGVVQIQVGDEAGPVSAAASLGTSARIVDFDQHEDGLLGILARGERRFRVLEHRVQNDGLRIGTIEWIAESAPQPLPPEHAALAELLGRLLPELGEPYSSLPLQLADAGWVGSRLAEILPLPPDEKQNLLELDDPLARITRLASLVRRNAG
ncbi:MAG: LON peptidase substrate-binding domain-containing protein [Steroidobacteraceae bacterium]